MIIKFDRPTRYDSKGRSGLITTTGVEITDQSIDTDDAEGREHTIRLHPISTRGEASEACRLCIAKSALPEVIAALRDIQNTIARDFDDVSTTDRFYLRRIYDLIGQGSLERLVEAIEGYKFEDPAVKTGFFNLEAEIYRRAAGEPQTGAHGTDPRSRLAPLTAALTDLKNNIREALAPGEPE